ncbi:hypothetical protein [Actinokineospora terrae]|uniref:Uncharacterized protein n=1 Tax=Actinokineospora terrae TaxID=155974 RepID=A0A1H9VY26_9PSEU|nr:hypothetical protein [Actinokineospora terrae]SES26690.1 hypothetical protein SAMN04487818_109194 [Actinokineospora terrae]
MTDEVRDLLGRAFGAEPPLGFDRDGVVADGRRRLRRRRAAATGGVAAAVAVAVFGAAVLSSGALGLSGPSVLPASPSGPVSTATPEPLPTSPVLLPGAPTETPRTTVTTKTLERSYYALRDSALPWPAGVRPVAITAGRQWYEFDGGELKVTLETPKGDRLLQISVYFTAALTHMMDCVNPSTGKPLPHCTTTAVGGAKVRTSRDFPDNGPTVVQVVADRSDSVTVEVTETAGTHGRLDQVLPDSMLVKIATLPGITP